MDAGGRATHGAVAESLSKDQDKMDKPYFHQWIRINKENGL
jgi:hypothetical protein